MQDLCTSSNPWVADGLSGDSEKCLRFKLIQNDSRRFPYIEYTLPLSEESMAGYAALHGEVISLSEGHTPGADGPYRFNPRYDQETGYCTRSLLTVPMKNARSEVIGVMQLVNCKRNRAAETAYIGRLRPGSAAFPGASGATGRISGVTSGGGL